jgi:hypothetical protein
MQVKAALKIDVVSFVTLALCVLCTGIIVIIFVTFALCVLCTGIYVM